MKCTTSKNENRKHTFQGHIELIWYLIADEVLQRYRDNLKFRAVKKKNSVRKFFSKNEFR